MNDAERAPGVIFWARVYCGLHALVYAGWALFGLGVLLFGVSVGPSSSDPVSAKVLGAAFALLGIAFAIVTAWAARAERKPQSWYLNLVVFAAGVTDCASLPFAVALIWYWLKPNVKQWYAV